jgi:hypothetical protein
VAEPKPGINLRASGRKVGRHAARIAMLSSKYDHVAASVLVQVGSVMSVAVFSAERRTREMMQVLEILSYDKHESAWRTYKKPSPNINISITFCRIGRCKDRITGRGRTQVPKSVAMLMHAGA